MMDGAPYRASEYALFVRNYEARLDQRAFCQWL
jgi:hypothetical protein